MTVVRGAAAKEAANIACFCEPARPYIKLCARFRAKQLAIRATEGSSRIAAKSASIFSPVQSYQKGLSAGTPADSPSMPFLFYRFIITQLFKISQGEIIPISVSTRRKEQPHHLKSSCAPAARRAGKLPDPSYNATVQDFARRNHSHQRFNEAGDINSPPVIYSYPILSRSRGIFLRVITRESQLCTRKRISNKDFCCMICGIISMASET